MAAISRFFGNCAKLRPAEQHARRSRRRPRGIAAALLAGMLALGAASGSFAFDAGRASFTLMINGELAIPYRVFAIYVLPGEVLRFESLRFESRRLAGRADAGSMTELARGVWQWTAPGTPGLAELEFRAAGDLIRINALVLYPADRIVNGRINEYRIDDYPEPLNGDPVYIAPDGFIELSAGLEGLELSPHFTLGQFPSKQSTEPPHFLVLREQLLLKLELLLERVNEAGVAADSLTIMSGFRTPMYNRVIGNGRHSRHIYGGAADVYIDVAPQDGLMDDLNRDGTIDIRDAQWLYRLADDLFSRAPHSELRGGLGVYASTSAHGPFLHIDARGRRARWGLLP